MQAICKHCNTIISSGIIQSPKIKLTGQGQESAPIAPPEEMQRVIEWHKLTENMYAHLLHQHPEEAAEPLEWVTVFVSIMFSSHFSGAADFEAMKDLAVKRAREFLETLPGAVTVPTIEPQPLDES